MKNKKNRGQKSHPVTSSIFKKRDSNARHFLFFLFRFVFLFVMFEICYTNEYCEKHFFSHVNNSFAFLGSKTLNLFGMKTSINGDTIFSSQFSIGIQKGCDSMEALAIFLSGVLAFPSTYKIKLYGLITGTFIILFFNLVRIANLFWLGIYHNDLFELFHIEVWQVLFITLALGLWHIWKQMVFKEAKIK